MNLGRAYSIEHAHTDCNAQSLSGNVSNQEAFLLREQTSDIERSRGLVAFLSHVGQSIDEQYRAILSERVL